MSHDKLTAQYICEMKGPRCRCTDILAPSFRIYIVQLTCRMQCLCLYRLFIAEIYVKIPRKCHNHETQPSRGTKGRRGPMPPDKGCFVDIRYYNNEFYFYGFIDVFVDNLFTTQQTHNVATTSLQRRCNVMTMQRRFNDVGRTLCVFWEM